MSILKWVGMALVVKSLMPKQPENNMHNNTQDCSYHCGHSRLDLPDEYGYMKWDYEDDKFNRY